MPPMFQGLDRKKINALKDALEGCIQRDQRTHDPKPTTALSTRNLVFSAKKDNVIDETWELIGDRVLLHVYSLLELRQGDPPL